MKPLPVSGGFKVAEMHDIIAEIDSKIAGKHSVIAAIKMAVAEIDSIGPSG